MKLAAFHLPAALAGATSKTVIVGGLLVGVTTAATASVVVIGSSAIVPHTAVSDNPGSQFIVTPDSGGTPVVVVPRTQKTSPHPSTSGAPAVSPSVSPAVSPLVSPLVSPSVSLSPNASLTVGPNPSSTHSATAPLTKPTHPQGKPTGTVVDVSNPKPTPTRSSHNPEPTPPSPSPSSSRPTPRPTPTAPPQLPAATSSPGQQSCGYFPSSSDGCCLGAAQLRNCGGSEKAEHALAGLVGKLRAQDNKVKAQVNAHDESRDAHGENARANGNDKNHATGDNGRHCARRR